MMSSSLSHLVKYASLAYLLYNPPQELRSRARRICRDMLTLQRDHLRPCAAAVYAHRMISRGIDAGYPQGNAILDDVRPIIGDGSALGAYFRALPLEQMQEFLSHATHRSRFG